MIIIIFTQNHLNALTIHTPPLGKKIVSIVFLLTSINFADAQKIDGEYFNNLADAKIAFNTKKYELSISCYKKIIEPDSKPNIKIGLAEAYIFNGNIDSGYQIIKSLIEIGYFFLDGFKINASFVGFSADQLDMLKKLSENNKELYIANQKNPAMVDTLFKLFYEDQEVRRLITIAGEKYGSFSKEAMEINTKMGLIDSIAFIFLQSMIKERGILSIAEIGIEGSRVLFTMLQHTGEDFMIDIYPMVKNAYEKNQIAPISFHFFQDRTFKYLNKPQIFGTQWKPDKTKKNTYKLYKLKNLKKANELRIKYGRLPLELNVKVLDSESDNIKYEL